MVGTFKRLSRVLVALSFVALATVAAQSATAQSQSGDPFLESMSKSVKALGPYEVQFEMSVSGQDGKYEGRYIVDENRYILYAADQVVYGDGKLRYTANDKDKELVIEKLESSTPMIIANPAQAFLELNRSLNSTVIGGYNDRMVSFTMTPKDSSLLFRSCFLTISRYTNLPLFVSYETDEEHVSMRIVNFVALNRPAGSVIVKNLDSVPIPDGFEVLDIR